MSEWQLQEAKARLSEVIRKTSDEGPQRITLHGKPAAVVISSKEYERLRRRRMSFVRFMRKSPLRGMELDIEREQTPTRKVDMA